MVHQNSALTRGWLSLTAATIVSLLTLVPAAYAEQAGPAGFADLAEKIGPSVFAVTSKHAVPRDRLRGQQFEFGKPKRDRDDEDPPTPGDGGQGKAADTA